MPAAGDIIFRDPSVPLTPAQADARRRVAKLITDEPGSFDMDWWENYSCGTTRCIAGWAQWYARGRVDEDTVAQDAVDALGLTVHEYEPPGHAPLFYTTNPDATTRMTALAQAATG